MGMSGGLTSCNLRSKLRGYAEMRKVLPGSQSHRCPETHRRGQPLHSEAPSAKNAPESTICGVLRKRPTTTGSMLWLVPVSFPRSGSGGPIYLDAAVEQRRHEDAKAEDKAMPAISPKPETLTWQVNPNPPPSLPFTVRSHYRHHRSSRRQSALTFTWAADSGSGFPPQSGRPWSRSP